MNVSIVMRTASGTIATVVTSYHAIIPQHDYLMIGRESSLNFANGELYSPVGLVVTRTGPDPLPDSMPRQNAEFFRSYGRVENQQSPPAPYDRLWPFCNTCKTSWMDDNNPGTNQILARLHRFTLEKTWVFFVA